MKLKISENSLFAILLRSPWWISFLIAIAIAVGTRAALPQISAIVGITAAMPLVVVGCIAAWRQWRAPSKKTVARVLELSAGMSWREFSDAVEAAFVRDGFEVTRLDGAGADFALMRKQRLVLVSCKRWKAASNGIAPLRELADEARTREARETMFLTLGELSEQARRYALENRIGVLQGAGLGKLLRNIAGSARAA